MNDKDEYFKELKSFLSGDEYFIEKLKTRVRVLEMKTTKYSFYSTFYFCVEYDNEYAGVNKEFVSGYREKIINYHKALLKKGMRRVSVEDKLEALFDE